MANFKTKTFNKTLNLLIKKANLSAAMVARGCGIPESTIRRLRNENTSNPTANILIALSKFFNISVDQLLGITPLTKNEMTGGYKQETTLLSEVPLITWGEAIEWPDIALDKHKKVSTDIEITNQLFALLLEEKEEYEGFIYNSILIVNPEKKLQHKDYVIVQKQGQTIASLKQVLFHDGDMYLDPLNKKFSIAKLDDNYKIIGVVVQTKVDLA